MLVIISDLHLCDGTTGASLSPGAFSIFAQRLRELAMSASWRADGAYRPIDRIDLVLLGDMLDVIRSAHWTARPNIRPWHDTQAPDFADQIGRITADILRTNAESLAVLQKLATDGGMTVPPMSRGGKPAYDAEAQAVHLRTHYMVGNHDWFYHLPGSEYSAIRHSLVEQMGLSNPSDQPFPHDAVESEELLAAMRRHKVTARHGDLYDPLNFEGDRDASSLGDMIVIELVTRFAAEVASELADDLPASAVAGLNEIDNVRPLLLIPVWIDSMLECSCTRPAVRQQVKRIWDRLADEFLAIRAVRERDTWNPVDLVDGLQRALKFSKRLSIGWASSIVEWTHKIRGSRSTSYHQHALAEQDFRNRRAKHIVYGHTHAAESIPLDASYAEGYVLNQMYFNSGTWRRVHRQTRSAPAEHEFIASDVMTYLAFFQEDERKGRPYETWSGTLGYQSAETPTYRIDPGNSSHVTGHTVPASSLQGHAPHFTALPAKSGRASTGRIG